MSTSDRLLMIFHVGFAIFSLGPLTAATSASPRYIRRREVDVVRFLNRATRIYGLLTLGVLFVGLFMADGDFARAWLTISITLYVVALVLLLIVERDQRKALHLLELAAVEERAGAPRLATPPEAAERPEPGSAERAGRPDELTRAGKAGEATSPGRDRAAGGHEPGAHEENIAAVERGRITVLSGVIALTWVVILFLMVWGGR